MKIESVSRKEVRNIVTKAMSAGKGDAGSVLIILGSDQYVGAGVMAGMAALRAGVDIVGILAPEAAAVAIQSQAPDLIVYKVADKRFNHEHLKQAHALIDKFSALLLGPGADLGEGVEKDLIKYAMENNTPIILDADVANSMPLEDLSEVAVLVNNSEYLTLVEKNKATATDKDVIEQDEKAAKRSKERIEEERQILEQERVLEKVGSNVVLQKGQEDILFIKEHIYSISGGSLRASVAGTGDILAGIAASFRAQGASLKDAVMGAAVVAKRTAELLEEKQSFSFVASDFLHMLPAALKELKVFRIVKHTISIG